MTHLALPSDAAAISYGYPLPPWLPRSRLGLLCRSFYLDRPMETVLFIKAMCIAISQLKSKRHLPKSNPFLSSIGCPRRTIVYAAKPQSTESLVLFSLRTEHFFEALTDCTTLWLPMVTDAAQIPRAIIAVLLSANCSISNVFPNITQNNHTLHRRFWLDMIAMGNLLVYNFTLPSSESCRFLFDPLFPIADSPLSEHSYDKALSAPSNEMTLEDLLDARASSMDSESIMLREYYAYDERNNDRMEDEDDDDILSIFTDTSERLLSGIPRAMCQPENPAILCISKNLDSYTLSAAIYATLLEAHRLMVGLYANDCLMARLIAPTCPRGCCRAPLHGKDHWTLPEPGASIGPRHSSYRGIPDTLEWCKSISHYNLTVGFPTPEALYRRVIDLLNGVHRERTSSDGRGRTRIPFSASHNFETMCPFCVLVKRLHALVLDYIKGTTESIIETTIDLTISKPRTAYGIGALNLAAFGLGIHFIQALEHFRDMKSSIDRHWKLQAQHHWSSQNITILYGIERDPKFLSPTQADSPQKPLSSHSIMAGPRIPVSRGYFDSDDSPLRLSSNGRSPSSSSSPDSVGSLMSSSFLSPQCLIEPDDDVFVLKLSQIADVRFSVGVLNAILEEHHIKARQLLYTISKSGRYTMLIIPKQVTPLLTSAIVPYLNTFRYTKQSLVLWTNPNTSEPEIRFSCNQTFAHLQVLRNFYSDDRHVVFFAIKWIGRMLFRMSAETKHNLAIPHSSPSFDRYQNLANLLLLFDEQELIDMLRLPYARADTWCKRRRGRGRRLTHHKPHQNKKGPLDKTRRGKTTGDDSDDDDDAAPMHIDSDIMASRSERTPADELERLARGMAETAERERQAKLAELQNAPMPQTTSISAKSDHRTIFFSEHHPSFYSIIYAYLNPINADLYVAEDTLKAVWFTLIHNRSLWARYHLLAGIICEIRKPPDYGPYNNGGRPQVQNWQRWINHRTCATQHCVGEPRLCFECQTLRYETCLPYARPPSAEAITDMFRVHIDDARLATLAGPPPPFHGDLLHPETMRASEDDYFLIHECLDFNAALYRRRECRIQVPDNHLLLPDSSHVYLGLRNYMLQDVLYEFALDPDVSRDVARRVFLGIHSASRQSLIRPSMPPRDLTADDMCLSQRTLESMPEYLASISRAKAAAPKSEPPKARDDPGWISRFVRRGRPMAGRSSSSEVGARKPPTPTDPSSSAATAAVDASATLPIPPLPIFSYMKPTLKDHHRHNYSAIRRMHFFVAAIEAMFYMDFELFAGESSTQSSPPAEPTPVVLYPTDSRRQKISNSFYGTKRMRHQMTVEIASKLADPEKLSLLCEQSFKVPAGFITFDIPRANIEHALNQQRNSQNKMEIITHDMRVKYFDQCIPLWRSPLSFDTIVSEKCVSGRPLLDLSPFYGSAPLLLPLTTAYQVTSIEGD